MALHSLDDIIIKSHKKPFKNPRKPKTASSNSNSTIFELDLSRVIELDSSLSQSETRIPILIECLLKSSDRMIETSGIFRKSSAVCTITGTDSILNQNFWYWTFVNFRCWWQRHVGDIIMIKISRGADTNCHPHNHLAPTWWFVTHIMIVIMWMTLFLMLVNISNIMYGVTNISKLSPTKIESKKIWNLAS